MNQIFTLNNPERVDMPLNKKNKKIKVQKMKNLCKTIGHESIFNNQYLSLSQCFSQLITQPSGVYLFSAYISVNLS